MPPPLLLVGVDVAPLLLEPEELPHAASTSDNITKIVKDASTMPGGDFNGLNDNIF
jgi:hypothetical protein